MFLKVFFKGAGLMVRRLSNTGANLGGQNLFAACCQLSAFALNFALELIFFPDWTKFHRLTD
ncbi:MAG: hypothetical protein CMM10_15410 [Rhodospirillaceae bacterium]|nr:hypothetical protein [Rhodospirillaceae bacterium]